MLQITTDVLMSQVQHHYQSDTNKICLQKTTYNQLIDFCVSVNHLAETARRTVTKLCK